MIASHDRLSLADLFALPEHAHLAEYVPAFKGASIDADLASDMSIDDLRALLPDAPLGHCLLMRRVLRQRSAPHAFVPAGCDSSVVAVSRLVGRAAAAGDTREWMFENLEINLIVSSLFFAVSFQALLSTPESCAGGVECPVLLTVDAWLWAVISAFFLSTVTFGWIVNHFTGMVHDEHLPGYALDNFLWFMAGGAAVILGVSLFPVAAAARVVILLDGNKAYLSWAGWSLVGLFSLVFILEWVYYAMGIQVTHKFKRMCIDGSRYQWGVFCCSCLTKKKLRRGSTMGQDGGPQMRYTCGGADGTDNRSDGGMGEEKGDDGITVGKEAGLAGFSGAEMKLPYF